MKSRLILVVLGLVVAAGIAAFVVYSRSERDSDTESSERIKVEVRAMPVAKIRVNGKSVGKTPLSLQYPKSNKQIVVEATMVRHLVRRGGSKDEIYQDTRTITLDRDHLIDVTFDTAKLISVEEKEREPTLEDTPTPERGSAK